MVQCSSYATKLLAFCLLTFAPSLMLAQPFKAVNLGNWLIVEGFMNFSFFEGIPNNDLLDGTKVRFKSTKLDKYLIADVTASGSPIVVNRSNNTSFLETFRLWRFNETFFNLRSFNKKFVGLEDQGTKLVAVSPTDASDTIFQIVRNVDDPNRVRLQASNGKFVQAKSEDSVTADYEGSGWDDDNPSVFTMTVDTALRGDYQFTNGYGPEKASKILQEYWNSYITEEDFSFLAANGIDAVKIPVGWWIAYDPTPPKPFVGGSLQVLDNAFTWAEKYGIKVIVDMHAPQKSPNGHEHSGTRDGYIDWGESNIEETLFVIEFLVSRYAKRPGFVAIALLNEPRASGVDIDTLKKYYKAGYDIVRKYTRDAYVILSTRLGAPDKSAELLPFASSLSRTVLEVHYYLIYSDGFTKMNAEVTIDFLRTSQAHDLEGVTPANGSLSFVGEWTGEWRVQGATKEDYQNFVKAQQEVYGIATFGWAYWTYKCALKHWNLRWMIENNFINVSYSKPVPASTTYLSHAAI